MQAVETKQEQTPELVILGTLSEKLKTEFIERFKDDDSIQLRVLDKQELDLTIYTISLRDNQREEQMTIEDFVNKEENKVLAAKLAKAVSEHTDKLNGGWFKLEKIQKYFKMTESGAIQTIANLKAFGYLVEDEKIQNLFKVIFDNKQKAEYHKLMLRSRETDLIKVQEAIALHKENFTKFTDLSVEEGLKAE